MNRDRISSDEGVDLLEVVHTADSELLILGDPGSGKSTSMAVLAVDAARDRIASQLAPMPIWVSLSSVASPQSTEDIGLILSGVPEVEFAVARGGVPSGERLTSLIRREILSGHAFVILDGLDEVKEYALNDVRSAISGLLELNNSTKIVATCRTFDYRRTSPNRRLPIRREVEILPYREKERLTYIDQWYSAATRVGRFTPHQAAELQGALRKELSNPDIAELAGSPLLLALLTLIHSEEAKLPDTRAVVCERAVTYMLADSAKWRMREANASTVASAPVLSLAIEVAHEIHVREETDVEQSLVGITRSEIELCAEKICSSIRAADEGRKAPSPTDLVARLLGGHGLVVERSFDAYGFVHRSFQEFLAGQYYSAGAHQTAALSKGSSSHWREPFRLMASYTGHAGENIYYILALIEGLCFGALSSPASKELSGEMLAEIGRRRLALRQFDEVLREPSSGDGGGLWARVRDELASHVEDFALSLEIRERSASAVSQLGDHRFPSGNLWRAPQLIKLETSAFKVPAGISSNPAVRPTALRRATVPAPASYSIGRYPVTNAEFRQFIEADGYANARYWPGSFAEGWVSGDPAVLAILQEHWLTTVHEHHAKEIRDGEINERDLVEEGRRRIAPRREPFYWTDRRFNSMNQPVVGLNYWECVAYCMWLTDELRDRGLMASGAGVRIPTESEWEWAARGAPDSRTYPWGEQWSDELAHVSTNLLKLRRPSAVGIYPPGWSGGPSDMAGNVWEWTSSIFLPLEPMYDSQRGADTLQERVVRGSSWYNTADYARCSARGNDRSYNLFYDVGFRICVIDEG
jgi:formylglycine-generating enzyme required for sulfatase activity